MPKYNNTKINHEDLIMKKAMDVFAQEGLKFFNINKKVKESGTTEIVVLEAKNLHMDYTFLMEDDTYIHFEFQTTDKGKDDLIRFRAYESLLSLQTKKDVVTYVVYSNDIKNPQSKLTTGISEFNIKVILMHDKDGDLIFEKIENKLNKNEKVTKQDLVELTFTPIMGGKLKRVDRILKSIRLVKRIDNEYKYDIESMLYAFADKFLDAKDLERVKEEISMTKLGEMLIKDGVEKGIDQGKAQLLIKLLLKKFKKVPQQYIDKIQELPPEVIETIATDIFDLENVQDLERYL